MHDLEMDRTEDRPDAVGLPFPHQAGIDVDRDQVVVNGAGCKSCTDRTVDTPGEGHDHLLTASGGLDLLY